MTNVRSFISFLLFILLALFCGYKMIIVKSHIIRINYIIIFISCIITSITFYNDYISMIVKISKIKDSMLFYGKESDKESVKGNENETYKIGERIILYKNFFKNEYYVPSTFDIFHFLPFLSCLIICASVIYTKHNYPEEFKLSDL